MLIRFKREAFIIAIWQVLTVLYFCGVYGCQSAPILSFYSKLSSKHMILSFFVRGELVEP
ncbi:hypothetical protein [Moraxella nasicaprae]|uniref:Uncharacterized protein n=1 Tax=Moraxella nasicaprae TaxID=2904122 RepID=A0ABY6F2I7_9GAMM|nr:hypothetical protein [Moraxella nasicaprae]UXZ04311.1 hypothetical protein LU297_06845 [Moraxella nasicaprae]